MGIGYLYFKGRKIISLDLEGVVAAQEKIDLIDSLNSLIAGAEDGDSLVLVNLKDFMPGHGFMEFATSSLGLRADKIERAAYIGLGKRNRKLFDSFDKYNQGIVERKSFDDREAALLWLTERRS
jgi:hypothetical protein